MTTTIWLAIGGAVAAVLIWKMLAPSLDREIRRTVKTRDPEPLIAALGRVSSSGQPNAFNHAIRRLWDDYERELAMPVIRAFVQEHPAVTIAQYWLSQAQGVEPELAREGLGEQFLQRYYQPELAASCGPAG